MVSPMYTYVPAVILVVDGPNVPLIFVTTGVAVLVSSSRMEFTMRFHEATETWFPADLRSDAVNPAERAAYAPESETKVKKNAAAEYADFLIDASMLGKIADTHPLYHFL